MHIENIQTLIINEVSSKKEKFNENFREMNLKRRTESIGLIIGKESFRTKIWAAMVFNTKRPQVKLFFSWAFSLTVKQSDRFR